MNPTDEQLKKWIEKQITDAPWGTKDQILNEVITEMDDYSDAFLDDNEEYSSSLQDDIGERLVKLARGMK